MFAPPNPVQGRQRLAILFALALQSLPVVLLILAARPIFIAPSSLATGNNGYAVTHLYWPAALPLATATSATRLAWHKPAPVPPKSALLAQVTPHVSLADQTEHASSAGSPLGSSTQGASFGHDVRPALPLAEHDPIVNTDDLPGHLEGTIVVEITIDTAGNIVGKSVLQSLGPSIDNAVLSALDGWRFRPATRDSVPVASKQDVVYHFRPS